MYIIEVVLPLPLFQTFTYLSREYISPGKRVLVPFKNEILVGIVKNCIPKETLNTEQNIKLKSVKEVIDETPFYPPQLFSFLEWVADYYLSSLGTVFKIALPAGTFSPPSKRIFLTEEGRYMLERGFMPQEFSKIKNRGYDLKNFLKKTGFTLKLLKEYQSRRWIEIKSTLPEVKPPVEKFVKIKDIENCPKEVLNLFENQKEIPEKIFKKHVSSYKFKKLIKNGILEIIEYPKLRKVVISSGEEEAYKLTPSQKKVFEDIRIFVEKGNFEVILLYGVTGSGKSLIYLELIKEVLKTGKKVLVLVPEIALTTSMELLLLKTFKGEIAILHSGLSQKERLGEWQRILRDGAKIVLGTRSAIFAPVNDLGLIIVDEEHDPSYKEEFLPCKYHARDLAIIRGKLQNVPVLLGSATPSVKSFYFASTGKYKLFILKERPFADLPEVKSVKHTGFRVFSIKLIKEIKNALLRKKSVFLYLNRRGYAPIVECRECHYIWTCPNCGIPLTYHKEDKLLLCHYCNFKISSFSVCPKCKGTKFKFLRAGTEKVEELVKKLFPDVNVIRIDRDAINTEKKLLKVLEKIYEKGSKIIIGTQMGAHGHNFPEVELVGILRAEEGLFLPFYKAGERTFQLLVQACGRAGRKKEKGKVILQSLIPEHYVIRYAIKQDYISFFKEEIKRRQDFGFPPFSRLVVVRLEGINEEKVKEKIFDALKLLEKIRGEERGAGKMEILGPAPCPMRKLRSFYRWHILIKSFSSKSLHNLLKPFIITFKPAGLKLTIDIDPEEIL